MAVYDVRCHSLHYFSAPVTLNTTSTPYSNSLPIDSSMHPRPHSAQLTLSRWLSTWAFTADLLSNAVPTLSTSNARKILSVIDSVRQLSVNYIHIFCAQSCARRFLVRLAVHMYAMQNFCPSCTTVINIQQKGAVYMYNDTVDCRGSIF